MATLTGRIRTCQEVYGLAAALLFPGCSSR
jgi:hypothetical protein